MTILTTAARHPAWPWLKARGWEIVPDRDINSTGAVDWRRKLVLIKPAVYVTPNSRHRRYVLPHELWHAVHAEALGFECAALMSVQELDRKSAVEAVAQACTRDGTWRIAAWIRAGIVWHNRNGYRYRWADVTSAEAKALAHRLRSAIT